MRTANAIRITSTPGIACYRKRQRPQRRARMPRRHAKPRTIEGFIVLAAAEKGVAIRERDDAQAAIQQAQERLARAQKKVADLTAACDWLLRYQRDEQREAARRAAREQAETERCAGSQDAQEGKP